MLTAWIILVVILQNFFFTEQEKVKYLFTQDVAVLHTFPFYRNALTNQNF